MAQMNYSGGRIEGEERLALPSGEDTGRSSRRRMLLAGLMIVVVIGVMWALFGQHKKAAPAAMVGDQTANVTVVVPGTRLVSRTVAATGTLAARVDMPVGIAGEGGRITAVLVQPGQWVGAGQVLATVDRSVQSQAAASLAAQIKVAQADAKLAQSELDRAQQLVGRGFISKADIETKTATRDAAVAKVNVARAALAEQQATNGRLDIRAPAAGLVLTRTVEPGQIVSGGSGVLFRMAKDGEVEMRAQLAENDLMGMHVGAPAQVTPVGSARSFPGSVWQVSPVIDQTTRQGIARIAVKYDPALRPGGFASANVQSGTTTAPVLPQSAILSDDKGNYVYIIDAKNKAERRNVTLGPVSDDGVAIASGIRGNETVVLSAGAFLNPGQTVKPERVAMASAQ